MKIRPNMHEERILYLRAENDKERAVLKEMWENGIVAGSWGGGGKELGICSKKYFGSGSISFEQIQSSEESETQ